MTVKNSFERNAHTNISVQPIEPDTVHYLPDLLDGQARHHGTRWTASLEDFKKLLFQSKHIINGFYIYMRNHEKPIGYALTTPMYTQEGSGLCLQDLYVSPAYRSAAGAGTQMMAHIISIAQQERLNFIEFSVLQSNCAATFAFYEKKCKAHVVPKKDYDFSEYLHRELPRIHNPYRDYFYPQLINSAYEFDYWMNMIDPDLRSRVVNEKMRRGFRDAAQSNTAELIVATTKGNKIIAMAVSNINFYSDCASLGYDLQPPVFFIKNVRKRKLAFYNILEFVQQRSLLTDWKGQLICAVPTQEADEAQWQEQFVQELKARPAGMLQSSSNNHGAADVHPWITYQIPQTIIHGV